MPDANKPQPGVLQFDLGADMHPDFLRAMVEAAPECIKIVSPEGNLVFMNRAGLCMIEGQKAQLEGANIFGLIASEDRSDWIERHNRVCAGERLTWEFDIVGLKGTRRHLETHAVPILLSNGRTAQLAVSRDATRRTEEESVRLHLAAIVDSSDDAIISKTLDGIIESWNAGAERIFGYTAEEAIGKSVLMLLPPDRREEEAGILARLRAGERVDHFESVRVSKDGRHIDVSLTISPVRDSSGRIIGASKVARDISSRKQYERDLQVAKQAAEEANRQKDELLANEKHARAEVERAARMKDEFLANLSHELRTPLNAILGWAQILGNSPSPEDICQGIEVIERNARSQVQIIEDLLDMSRIISGKIRLEVQRVDLATIVRAAIETIKPTAEAKGVRVQNVLDAQAGPVSGDPNRLQQVFWNLLTNAIKFTPKGGRIQVLLERVNSHLEVSVIDTGEGIAADFLPYVFDRFRQADAGTTRRHAGLGLGLAIVKQLVELHGGNVRVKSGGLGLGSTFIVSLPLTIVHPELEPLGERRHPTAGPVQLIIDARVKIEGVRVLVVDDEPDALVLVKRVLQDCKAVVTTATSAAQAMELLKASPQDIIISDIGMPEEDGYEFIKKVRALPPDQGGLVAAIALTAYARADDRVRAMLAGFEQYLVKPVEPAELITLVSVLVRARDRRYGF